MSNTIELAMNILVDDSVFAKAVQTYQNIITRCLRTKMELWIGIFIQLNHGIADGLLTNEFPSKRGAIYLYFVLFMGRGNLIMRDVIDDDRVTNTTTYTGDYDTRITPSPFFDIGTLMTNTTVDIFNTFAALDEYIDMLFFT